jgi:hypothetical protein
MNQPVDATEPQRTCFVIMPITDMAPYDQGHFRRIYEYLIKPACLKAGFTPVRSDDVERTNHIILDVLRRILHADVVVCDLSGRNPNVLFELGVRQAFNKPVVLIKDSQTERIFDIQGLRDIEYDSSLRVDRVGPSITTIATALTNTCDGDQTEVNSLIQLLGVHAATAPQRTEISGETSLILSALDNIGKRLAMLEVVAPQAKVVAGDHDGFPESDFSRFSVGESIIHKRFGKGKVTATLKGDVRVQFADGQRRVLSEDDKELDEDLPF